MTCLSPGNKREFIMWRIITRKMEKLISMRGGAGVAPSCKIALRTTYAELTVIGPESLERGTGE